MGMLVLVRHGQSEWNARRIFSGQGDPELTPKGVEEARNAGRTLGSQAIQFDMAYSSTLKRARKTLDLILQETNQPHLHVIKDDQLNERAYGKLTGTSIEEACHKHGEAQVHQWRNSLQAVPPGGESLEMTANRAHSVFKHRVLPQLTSGKNILIASHRNTIRGLIARICNLGQDETESLHIATAQPLFFQVTSAGSIEEIGT
ncbi:2,3-bisphosphoglycerate-dependent phosphoglycerate mutase [Pseudovibrio japonicus]|uniref:2,3-bisphosphoglycerate-dependent phosphoglycerate mutase n=1 Tax=Pseudovibrio japonicus TaxID=366534 RepID=A0ABQ3E4I3_9HYPH|nr:2,3-bisphosphoglycerate-dependent phosphoglycerate mutase [Pseudovibrio japonicus]GHB25898.1 2,3-bisphosphoglycerate-dependent phosphoglycerate mutase [Pseudovibrio japonicus]